MHTVTSPHLSTKMKSGKRQKGKRKRTSDDQSGGESSEFIETVKKIRTSISENPKSLSHSASESRSPKDKDDSETQKVGI